MIHNPTYAQWEDETLEIQFWWGRHAAKSPGMASQAGDQEWWSSPAPQRKHQCCVRAQHGGTFPIAIPRTCILSLEEGSLNIHASRISAFLKRSYYLKKSHYPPEMVDLSLLCSLLRGRVFSQGQGWCPSALCLYYLWSVYLFASELLVFILGDQLCSPNTPQGIWYMRYRLII